MIEDMSLRESLWNTAIMDWPAWGPDPKSACEAFAFGIACAWPSIARRARVTLVQINTDRALDIEEGFGMLQDLIPVPSE